jgi:exonuclease III
MATAATDGTEEITKGMKKLKISEEITVCTWNINGPARAELRKEVTRDTFNQQQYQDGTRLGQSDIICVQEMIVKPGHERGTDQEYLPFASDYGVEQSQEQTGNIYNAVYFSKEKFSKVDDERLKRTGEIYRSIRRECRMAICVLQIKSLPEQHNIIVVASVHNYSGRGWSGRGSEENYASLLFDFLSQLPPNITIIIAGDFNFDILACRDPPLTQYFHIPRYELRPLRKGLPTPMIDFIVVTKSKADAKLQISVSEMQAHDLQVDGEVDVEIQRKITNHSPVSAVIELKLKK